ncbi:MAG: diguanylate cyclase [Candidatus Omnitrophica bacterium]|nr:diguanylate cyclase [Candidatus Omnitrophota bacterium]MBU2250779.1 diguanylate cyclase [Candidatus Omnitrophota bacterium]MBU2265603.1 diguanylate cyclase [Candidatus Omnitrophota bacterium]MBU2474164.1 diguanylate cyclase [Candidatus Omnitrophota bacterium]
MKDIIYCCSVSSKNNRFLPFSCKKTSSLDASKKPDCQIIVFEESFLRKRKNFKNLLLEDKVCFIYFPQPAKIDLKLFKQTGCFDYFSAEDSKTLVALKLKRAAEFLKLKNKLRQMDQKIGQKDIELEKVTLIDPLTGCYNWRYFENRVPQEINRSRRHLYSVGFLAVDIDYFRHVNELYGIKVGDIIIKEVAALLKKALRREDILVHWREDEFFIIMPHLSARHSYQVARRLSEKIVFHKFRYKKVKIHIKASIGVVLFPEDLVFDARQVTSALNTCVSVAKKKGGNTIVLYSQANLKPIAAPKGKANVEELHGQIEKMNKLMSRDVLEMIYGFARAIEAKDSYTGKHVEYTAELAEQIAKALNLSEKNVDDIKHAAVLHDLGKVGIDKRILSKNGPLDFKEREVIKTHPAIAAEILREINGLKGSIPAILYHHERYDGGGYPLGLKGEEIPLSARIVAVADVYQALTSDRSYRKAYSKAKALAIIKSESGKQFDPKVVKVFLQVVKKIDAK